jgi:hypothetical protein
MSLKISRFYLSDKWEKNSSAYQWPHNGVTFSSAIAVPILKVLYVCPVFCSDVVLFIFYFDGTAVFHFLLFGFLFSFSVLKSVLYDSFSAQTLTPSKENFLLSEMSE